MPTLIAGAVAVLVLYLLLQMFRAANPAVLARAIRITGGVLALAVAAFTGAKGELAVAIPIGLFGAGLLGWSPLQSGFGNIGGIFSGLGSQRSSGQTSQVRSPYLDMTLDHDSGALTGPHPRRTQCRSRAGRVRPRPAHRDDPGLRCRKRRLT